MASGSIYERLGEAIGYGLAAVVLGPKAALERRARRAIRHALLDWCAPLDPVKLVAPRGVLRRGVTLATAMGPMAAEVTVDVHDKQAKLVASTPQLPPMVAVTVTTMLTRRVLADWEDLPTKTNGRLVALTKTLDEVTCDALIEHVAAGPLGRLAPLDVVIRPSEIEVVFAAPSVDAEWSDVGKGVTLLSTWLAERWPGSYRSW